MTGCDTKEEVEQACTLSIDEKQLYRNIKIYPNPFTTSTTIEYQLDQPSEVTISIFNHLGKQVELIQQQQSSGKQQITWNAGGLTPGMYIYTIQAGEQVSTGKMVFMK